MRYFLLLFVLLLFFLFQKKTFGQDIFYTQFFNATSSLNPALTGFSGNDLQISMNYRNNNRGLIAYQTYGFATEMKIMRMRMKPNVAAIGISMNMDDISQAGMKRMLGMASGAYHFALDKKNNHFLSLGSQIGIIQIQANPNDFRYPNQWSSSTGYSSFFSNKESFSSEISTNLDVNAGVFWYGKIMETVIGFGGISSFHLFKPKSFFMGEEQYMSNRWIWHGGIQYQVNQKLHLSPSFMMMSMSKARQYTGGLMAEYQVSNSGMAVKFGNWYRLSDRSFILVAGLRVDELQIAVSSEFFSRVQTISEAGNAFELSLIYSLGFKEKVRLKANPRNKY